MKHLTDEQLSARLDGELPPKQAEAAERHLAACGACRERLAALAGADTALARSLERDPGEPYFETFAGRVQARIAAGAAAGAPRESHAEAGAPARGGWLSRPSVLAWAGAATALVVVGAFAVQFATQQMAGARREGAPTSIVGADRLEARAPEPVPGEPSAMLDATGPADADQDQGAAAARENAPVPEPAREGLERRTLADTRSAAPSPPAPREEAARQDASGSRKGGVAAPQRLQEMRTLPSGEQVPVQKRSLPGAGQAQGFAAPPGDATKPRKPVAQPLAITQKEKAEASQLEKDAAARQLPAYGAAPSPSEKREPAAKAAPAPTAASGEALSNEAKLPADEAATVRLCGTVRSTQGRALAGATVTVVETGRSALSGADGSFCVEAPAAGASLAVLSLGHREYRATVRAQDAATPLVVALQPVDVLGQGAGLAGRLKTVPPPGTEAEAPAIRGGARTGVAPKALAGASAPAAIPALTPVPGETPDAAAAREATEAALRTPTVPAWSRAGALWSAVAASARSEAIAHEARFRAAEARMHAWRLARGSANRRAAFDAIEAFLAKAPAGAQRESVETWRRELPPR